MRPGLHVLFGFLTVLLCVNDVRPINTAEIRHVTHKLITSDIASKDIDLAFDNDQSTQALVHSETNAKVIILITLPKEYEVEAIEIITDLPSSLKQSVQIGYAQDTWEPSSSLAYHCAANRTATLCQPHCGRSNQGVVGRTILWTLERISESGWTRIYDVIIRGRSFDEQIVVKDKVADIALLKPYWDHVTPQQSGEQCDLMLWKLTDSSPASSTQPPIVSASQNVTIYFGQTYSVSKVALVFGQSEEQPSEISLHFGGRKPIVKTLTLSQDCSLEQEENGLYTCTTSDLLGYPFTNATLDVKGLAKLHIYGMPFFYPQIGVLSSEKSTTPESQQQLEVTCVALTCGSQIVAKLKSQIDSQLTTSCARYGRMMQCTDLELLRLRAHIPSETVEPSVDPGTVLVSKGAVVDDIAQIMTGLHVVKSSNSELVVSMPRTHHYYGQYKCRCLADDTISSVLESTATQLTPNDFDRDFVFQRNYTAQHGEQEVSANSGFLELASSDQDAFFRLVIEGHSLTENLELNATYMESGNLTSITGDYARTTVTEAFPRTADSQRGWPIPAYKVSLQEAWPDATDGEAITVEWKTTDAEDNERVLKDHLRVIALSPENDGHVRAWVWQRDEAALDMRAYYQIGEQGEQLKPERVYLQRTSCSAGTQPERISTILLSGSSCEAETGADKVTVTRTKSGCVVQFKIKEPSASDQYALYKESTDGAADTLIVSSAGMASDLQGEIDTADISMKFLSIEDDSNAGSSKINTLVTIHSKPIVDSSECRPMYISLHPTWPVDEQLEQRVTHSDTPFTFSAPHDQKLLVFDLELRIDSAGPDAPELRSRRSLTIPHPMAYRSQLNVDESKNDITWNKPPLAFTDMVQEFQVKVSGMTRACGNNVDLPTPTVHEDIGSPISYRIRLTEIPEVASNPNLLMDYKVSATPVFKQTGSGSVLGFESSINFTRGQLGQTALKMDEVVKSRTKRVFVSPSQMVSCLKDSPFTLIHELQVLGEGETTEPTYLEEVTIGEDPTSEMSESGRWYVINNLQPGRRYSLKAAVQYVTGEKDHDSAYESFWTKDEISVSAAERVASPGEHVVVNCTAAVGPSGKHQKRVEWKRQDGSPLPDGGRTEVVAIADASSGWSETVSLIFDKVEQGQASTYGCFVQPSVEHAVGMPVLVPTFKLSVSEIELDMDFKVASVGESVVVRCQSSQADQLIWLDTNQQPVPVKDQPDADDEAYASVEPGATGGFVTLLHIPQVRLAQTGNYACTHQGTNSKRVFRLRLNKELNLGWEQTSSPKSGEILKLSCTAKRSQQGEQLIWYISRPDSQLWIPLSSLLDTDQSIKLSITADEDTNTVQSILEMVQSPSTNGQFYCTLQPSHVDQMASISEHPETNAGVLNMVQPVIVVQKVKSDNAQEILAQCRGYPAQANDRLQWAFLPDGDEGRAIPIGHSAPVEPVSDELVSLVQSTFRLGDNTPASWPGSSGPQLLATARNLVARSTESSLFRPETLELIMHKPEGDNAELDTRLTTGTLVCRYRRPKSVVVMEGSIPMYATDGSDHAVVLQKHLTVTQLLDPTTPKQDEEKLSLASAGSGVISAKTGDTGKDNPDDGTGAVSRSASSLLLHLFSMAVIINWRLWC